MPRIYHYATDLKDFCAARERGELCEIDHAMYMYYLEVLPPVMWQRHVVLSDGTARYADFGFAEGMEPIIAFWQTREPFVRYFAQRTKFMNKGG
jgi:hypothetical protein